MFEGVSGSWQYGYVVWTFVDWRYGCVTPSHGV